MIDIKKAVHIISVKRNIENNFKHYFYLEGRLLYISLDPIFSSNNVKVLLDVYLYDYVEDKNYVYTMLHYQVTNNNFEFMKDTYDKYMKLIDNYNEFYNESVLSHNKVIDEYFKVQYYKFKRQIKINKILNVAE